MQRIFVVALVACAACGDDGSDGPDAGPCGDDIQFTGGYEDWDSTEFAFMGIFEATVAEVADPSNTATTAPNGRSSLCLPRDTTSQVTWTKDGFVTGRYTVEPDAVLGAYNVRGISTTRITTFHQDLGLTWDSAAALVEIEVRSYPSAGPVDGVTITVEGGGAGFHRDAAEAWVAGATTAGGELVIVPDVPVPADGTVTLTVDTGGRTCRYPDSLHVAAGEVAIATVACAD